MPQPQRYSQRFTGRVAIVTGAGTHGSGIGIGRAIAIAFAREGARVCLLDRELAQAEQTQRMLMESGGEGFAFAGDVSRESDCQRCVQATLARFGRIDVLVNNVGIVGPTEAVTHVDIDSWSATIDVNLKSVLLMSKHVIPEMTRVGGGSIINVSSIAGLLAHGPTAYGPSKAAMAALTREIAVTHGRAGIRANTIAPGYLWTPMADSSGAAASRAVRRSIAPLNIEGDAWDIASAALFLASEQARFITGVILPVDGGASVIGPLTAHAFATADPKAQQGGTNNE